MTCILEDCLKREGLEQGMREWENNPAGCQGSVRRIQRRACEMMNGKTCQYSVPPVAWVPVAWILQGIVAGTVQPCRLALETD
jgi:hypothetical protein